MKSVDFMGRIGGYCGVRMGIGRGKRIRVTQKVMVWVRESAEDLA